MLHGINVLVTEDDKLNQKIISFMLLKKGATVKLANNGHEAIEMMGREKFDIILMDLQMPVMDGFATTQYIRKSMNSDIPVIALTADAFANESDEYIEAGMNACTSKPIEVRVLCDLILSLTKENQDKHLLKPFA